MKIYGFPTFNVSKVLITAEELGVDYSLELLDPSKGEHKSTEHFSRHPLGKVPALEYNNQFYYESASICRLLAELNDNKLYADTPTERAEINEWVDMMGFHIGRWMSVLFFEDSIKPFIPNAERNQAAVDEATGFLADQLPVMEKALEKNAFLTGDNITIADTIAFAHCQTHDHSSLDFSNYPKISAWYQSIESRPSVARALDKLPNKSILPFSK